MKFDMPSNIPEDDDIEVKTGPVMEKIGIEGERTEAYGEFKENSKIFTARINELGESLSKLESTQKVDEKGFEKAWRSAYDIKVTNLANMETLTKVHLTTEVTDKKTGKITYEVPPDVKETLKQRNAEMEDVKSRILRLKQRIDGQKMAA